MIPQPDSDDYSDITDAIEDVSESITRLLQSLEHLQMQPRINDRLALTSAHRALKKCRSAEGLSPTARKEASSARQMCAAALGLEE